MSRQKESRSEFVCSTILLAKPLSHTLNHVLYIFLLYFLYFFFYSLTYSIHQLIAQENKNSIITFFSYSFYTISLECCSMKGKLQNREAAEFKRCFCRCYFHVLPAKLSLRYIPICAFQYFLFLFDVHYISNTF